MRRLSFFLLSLFLAGNMPARDIRVTVKTDNGGPAPYSFILVNDDPVGTTDSVGVFLLPEDRIEAGDTVFVANVGERSVGEPFDEQARRRGAVEITIRDIWSAERLDEAPVVAPDMEDFFRRHTKEVFTANRNGTAAASFEARITRPGQAARRFVGTFSVRNEIWSKDFDHMHQYGYFHHPIEWTTESDTTGYSRQLDVNVRNALTEGVSYFSGNLMRKFYRNLHRRKDGFMDLYFSVFERGNDTIRFRVSATSEDHAHSLQTILTIDEKEKSLLRSHLKVIVPHPGSGIRTFDIRMDYQYYRPRKNGPLVLLPRNVDYLIETRDGLRVEVTLRDIVFEVE